MLVRATMIAMLLCVSLPTAPAAEAQETTLIYTKGPSNFYDIGPRVVTRPCVAGDETLPNNHCITMRTGTNRIHIRIDDASGMPVGGFLWMDINSGQSTGGRLLGEFCGEGTFTYADAGPSMHIEVRLDGAPPAGCGEPTGGTIQIVHRTI